MTCMVLFNITRFKINRFQFLFTYAISCLDYINITVLISSIYMIALLQNCPRELKLKSQSKKKLYCKILSKIYLQKG